MNHLNRSHRPIRQCHHRMSRRCRYRRMSHLTLIRRQSRCRQSHRLNQSRYRRPFLLDLLSSRNSSLIRLGTYVEY
jgi:hypothetical protein